MHVALLTEYFVPQAPGGAEWSTLALAEQLTVRGVKTTIITADLADPAQAAPTGEFDAAMRQKNIEVARFKFPRKMHGAPKVFASYIFGNPVTEWYFAQNIRRLIRRMDFDLLHVQGIDMLTPAWRAARQRRVPVMATIRDYRALCPIATCLHREDRPPAYCDRKQFRRCIKRYLLIYDLQLSRAAKLRYRLRRELEWSAHQRQALALRDIDATVFVSDAVRRIYAAAGYAGRQPLVIHNLPPDSSAGTSPDELRRCFNLDGPMLLYVGRWSVGKGARELTEAWPLIADVCPQARLIVAGYREAPENPQPSERVLFAGPLEHADVLGLMRLSAVVLLPSRWPEPYSRVALEAMAAAKPLVVTDSGGNPELVRNGVTGFVVPRRDPESFAVAVNELLARPDQAREMGRAGQARLRDELNAERQLDELIEAYQRLSGKAM